MADIFISYAKEDRERAAALADIFGEHGWSVWWDRDIPLGKTFDVVIEEELTRARCQVVLWTEHSIGSNWVKAEAQEGLEREILIPALMDDVKIPLEFRRIQSANLVGWEGDPEDPSVVGLVGSVGRLLEPGRAGPIAEPGAPRAAPRRRRRIAKLIVPLSLLLIVLPSVWIWQFFGSRAPVQQRPADFIDPDLIDEEAVPPEGSDLVPGIRWSAQVGVQSWRNTPVFVGNQVFVASCGEIWNKSDSADGIYGFDVPTGRPLWFAPSANDMNDLTYVDGLVIGGSDAGEVIAVSVMSGRPEWTRQLRGKVYAKPLPIGEQVAVATGGGSLYLMDAQSGHIEAEVELEGPVRAGLATDGRELWVATQNGWLYHFDASEGLRRLGAARLVYPDEHGEPATGQELYGTGSFLHLGAGKVSSMSFYGAPVLLKDRIVLGFVRRTYYDYPAAVALERDLSAIVWFATDPLDSSVSFGNVRHSPAVYRDSLIFGDPYSNCIMALSVSDGRLLWLRAIGQPMFQHWSSPVVKDDFVYVARHDGFLHKLLARDGSRLWSIFLGLEQNAGLALLAEQEVPGASRTTVWNPKHTSPIFATPALSENTIAVGTDEGFLYLVEESEP